jgi:hypothetical protein
MRRAVAAKRDHDPKTASTRDFDARAERVGTDAAGSGDFDPEAPLTEAEAAEAQASMLGIQDPLLETVPLSQFVSRDYTPLAPGLQWVDTGAGAGAGRVVLAVPIDWTMRRGSGAFANLRYDLHSWAWEGPASDAAVPPPWPPVLGVMASTFEGLAARLAATAPDLRPSGRDVWDMFLNIHMMQHVGRPAGGDDPGAVPAHANAHPFDADVTKGATVVGSWQSVLPPRADRPVSYHTGLPVPRPVKPVEMFRVEYISPLSHREDVKATTTHGMHYHVVTVVDWDHDCVHQIECYCPDVWWDALWEGPFDSGRESQVAKKLASSVGLEYTGLRQIMDHVYIMSIAPI